ncbi:helix-turn-helix domain-containing protein [Actinomadura decatromicini]|uniref:XRE family transcriptional regulator n=1 Tax=Actinomadura decatromicini TaxID=2604572 RepID=A0A5D3FC86_9ACTN|nr:helix-turn-helix transcriptional regulator [Actinomadura decatromicini]TYK45931.1 XRE family transcriptional regulator [Actinomadura decatromicini]
MSGESFGEALRELMTERGIGVRALARQVPCNPGTISKLCRDERGTSEAMAKRLDAILGSDDRLLALYKATAAEGGAADSVGRSQAEAAWGAVGSPADLLSLAWTVGRLDQPMARRALTQLAAAVTAAPLLGMADPIDRLARALTRPAGIGEELVTQMEARCVGFHRLEFMLPAEQIFRALLGHLDEVTSLLEAVPADRWRRRLARTAGESAVLGAWLAWDLGDVSRAAALYRTAELAAEASQDPAIRACSAIYQSFAVSETAGHHVALRTLRKADDLLPGGADRATRAWLIGRQAEEAAALGDPAARDLIERASDLMAEARPQAERSWTRCLESPRFSHMRLTIATRLGDEDALYDEIGELVTTASDPTQKKSGRVLASIGLALTRLGDAKEGIAYGERAVEAVRVSQAGYAMTRLTELGSALMAHQSARARELRAAIGATRRELVSPRPSTPGMTPAPS